MREDRAEGKIAAKRPTGAQPGRRARLDMSVRTGAKGQGGTPLYVRAGAVLGKSRMEGAPQRAAGGWAARLRGPGGAAALVVLGVLLLLATRAFHPIPGLGNADIAGILYEADIINDGGVPFRDTLDMKAPGTWFLFAAIFRVISREMWAVQAVYTGWCLLAAPALWLAARALYGRGRADAGALPAGAAVLLYLGAIGWFDLNYSAWMTTPYAWAFACLIVGLRRDVWWSHLLGGVFAALAVAFKAQAFVLAPTFALVWIWGRWRGEPGARWSAWPLWLLGSLLGLAPWLLWYAQRGALPELISGLFPVQIAREYGQRSVGESWWLWRAGRIPQQLVGVFPLHVALAAAALLGAWFMRRERTPLPGPLLPTLIFFAMSVVGCGVGGLRFYIHYLTQYLPALALLAAHPLVADYLRRSVRPGAPRWERLPAAALAITCVVSTAVQVVQIPLGKAARVDHRGNAYARVAGEWIKARTSPEDTVQVWGWAAWSVYYWADRRAPSPVFKVLGQVTDYNQNGMFARSKGTDFRPGPAADMMLAALIAAPPAYFVRAVPFFPGVQEDPLDQWTPLRDLLARQYVQRIRFGKLRVYELRSRMTEKEIKAAERELARGRALKQARRKVGRKRPLRDR